MATEGSRPLRCDLVMPSSFARRRRRQTPAAHFRCSQHSVSFTEPEARAGGRWVGREEYDGGSLTWGADVPLSASRLAGVATFGRTSPNARTKYRKVALAPISMATECDLRSFHQRYTTLPGLRLSYAACQLEHFQS